MEQLTPTDAARAAAALGELEGYEETLSNRAAGTTNMVWGMAAAGIFLTYGTAGGWLSSWPELEWLFALLWIPWVAMGTGLTWTTWVTHAVSLQRSPAMRDGMKASGLSFLLFGTLVAATFGLLVLGLGLAWDTSAVMTLVNGLFALILGTSLRRHSTTCSTNTVLAGLWMALLGVTIGVAGLGHEPAALAGASACALGWFGSGLATYLRG
ncbi:MAG: hypothetical protein ACPGQL_06200 [Thermoplasmatota archaeon]